jgi:hypothetical protein
LWNSLSILDLIVLFFDPLATHLVKVDEVAIETSVVIEEEVAAKGGINGSG